MTILARISRPLLFSARLYASTTSELHPVAIKPSQKDDVVQFIAKYYTQTDPIAKALKLEPNEVKTYYSDLFDHFVQKPVSFAMYTADDRFAGLKLNSVVDFDDEKTLFKTKLAKYPIRVLSLLHLMEKFCNQLPILAPNVRKWLCFEILAVHPDFVKKGVSAQMWDLSVQKAHDFGCRGAFSFCKSAQAQQYLEKQLGFKTLKSMKYWDYVSFDGKKIFENITDPDSVKLMTKTW